ncbi:UTP--glucose-1-phosphate uridylyltransferase GalU [Methanobrevibacter sp.]|uniref:UTP--glucose-1-phosphate uridylyltransferase GalU n=1 Tax=Methanobrevibacter sp. TaxID=66852 RepID=UPI0025F38937|nr:UTP--glucose-1-phosphate uridylyltransferase GalU [Methanobrevibacter sp.]MBQ2831602.1 UTP--glucose-1-phosphate uridylyltransferase GalU [Methanobrevibacter sp.]
MKAVIPAAGLGTRFLPATKSQPKEMLPVYDKPAIQYVIEEALASGIDDILIVTGRNKRSIEDHFDKSYELEYTLQKAGKDRVLKQVRNVTNLADICYVRQKDLKGLGDAILCAERHIGDEPFAVLLGDSITKSPQLCTKQLIDVFNKYGKSAISIREVPCDKICSYGIVEADKVEGNVYKINSLIEKPKINQISSNLAIVGRYILTPDIFDKINQTEPGFNGEIQLTDALSKLDGVYGVKFDGKVFNIENRLEWIKSSIDFAMSDEEFCDDLIDYMKRFL